jgi:cyclopropane fatty-acyl-phospholipid synthase-like methyltransferase
MADNRRVTVRTRLQRIPEPYRRVRAELRLRACLRELGNLRRPRRSSGDLPPDEVVAATSLMTWDELAWKSSRGYYLKSGMETMAALAAAAVEEGLRLGPGSSVLELGCGGGRLIRHLRQLDGVRLVGSDAIADNVAWCRAHLPGIEFHHNSLEPPLAFTDDAAFDFVFAYSVFTHIPIEFQAPWVHELSRVLKPGGVAVITVLGDADARRMMSAEDYSSFQASGSYTMGADHPAVSASSAHIGSWDVFLSEEKLRELYEPAAAVVNYGSGHQVRVVLRRRDPG